MTKKTKAKPKRSGPRQRIALEGFVSVTQELYDATFRYRQAGLNQGQALLAELIRRGKLPEELVMVPLPRVAPPGEAAPNGPQTTKATEPPAVLLSVRNRPHAVRVLILTMLSRGACTLESLSKRARHLAPHSVLMASLGGLVREGLVERDYDASPPTFRAVARSTATG